MGRTIIPAMLLLLAPCTAMAAAPALDETPAGDDEWGYRPAEASV